MSREKIVAAYETMAERYNEMNVFPAFMCIRAVKRG